MPVKCSLGHENPDGSAFCDECGEPLHATPAVAAVSVSAPTGTQVCPSCGATNPAGEAFCSNCGANLLETADATVPTSVPAPEAIPVASSPVPAPAPAPVPVPTLVAQQARLIVEADNQEFDISGKNNVTIGREDAVSNIYPDIDLTPHGGEEGGVSRLHAHLFVQNGQYMIEDENSTNFTFVNRQRLAAKTPTQLHDNDEIKLGRVLLRFKTA